MIPNRDYTQMSEAEIAAADTSDWIAVLPLGAHEQHGPHLPFETDTIIAGGIACRLAAALGKEAPVTFLPVEAVGYSIEHIDVSGTRTLGFDEAVNRWIGIAEELSRQGIRKLLLLNAHGGNSPLMTVVATEARVRFSHFCVATSWTRFLEPGNHLSADEKAYGIHGGDIETSVMLVFAPDAVDMDKAEDFGTLQRDLAERCHHLRAYGSHAFGWKMQDLNRQGVTGNAAAATAEKGELYVTAAVQGLVELIDDMRNFDLSQLVDSDRG